MCIETPDCRRQNTCMCASRTNESIGEGPMVAPMLAGRANRKRGESSLIYRHSDYLAGRRKKPSCTGSQGTKHSLTRDYLPIKVLSMQHREEIKEQHAKDDLYRSMTFMCFFLRGPTDAIRLAIIMSSTLLFFSSLFMPAVGNTY